MHSYALQLLFNTLEIMILLNMQGARGSLVVKALDYKPEGHGFETRWGEI
jgi:hypothetical protein